MKLKPKHEERRINELKADERRRMYGRKKENGMSFKHPVKSILLIGAAVMFLTQWQMEDFKETGRLPKPRSEASFNMPTGEASTWKPGPNSATRRAANRVNMEPQDIQTFIDAALRIDAAIEEAKINPNPKFTLPALEQPIKRDDRWVRNEPKYIRRQMKLKHYISTGEWKEQVLDVPNDSNVT